MGGFHAHADPFEALVAARWLERMDARARLAGFVALALAAAATRTLEGAGVALWAALAAAWAGGLPLAFLGSRLAPLLVLLVPVALVVPFTTLPGSAPLWARWSWGPTDLGARAAALIALRATAAASFALLAVAVGPIDRTARALERLRVPARGVRLLLLTQRYAAGLREEVARVEAALAARGFRARADLATLRVLGGALGGLLVRSFRRAERVERAMRSRGFAGRWAGHAGPPARPADVALGLGLVAAAALLVAADRLAP